MLVVSRWTRISCQMVLLFIDVDHFKRINDTRRHNVGDQLLLKIARRIRQAVRDYDTLALTASSRAGSASKSPNIPCLKMSISYAIP
ncbi:MAG: diguanylate cyclase domain-containing protein [Methylomicrobium sp.]